MDTPNKRTCELCEIDISHKQSNARYCSRPHKEKHYRFLNRDKYLENKRNWEKKNRVKTTQADKERRHRETKIYGYSKRYLRTYARRHINELRAIKPEKCYKCGSLQFLNIHHVKYTKNPQDWEFICHSCHMKLHEPTTLL